MAPGALWKKRRKKKDLHRILWGLDKTTGVGNTENLMKFHWKLKNSIY